MITWQSLAFAVLSVAGIACCGIGGISIFAGGMSDNYTEARKAERGGCIMGAAGLAMVVLAFLLRLA